LLSPITVRKLKETTQVRMAVPHGTYASTAQYGRVLKQRYDIVTVY